MLGGRYSVRCLVLLCVGLLASCSDQATLPFGSPSPATVIIEYQFWPGTVFAYATYQVNWAGIFVSLAPDTPTNAGGDLQASDSMTIGPVQLNQQAGKVIFLPINGLRPGIWSFAINVAAGPNNVPISFGPCGQELYAGVTTTVKFV